jgi:uncharacterized integral membrane protein
MRNVKRLIFFVIVLLVLAVTIVFVLENQQPVALVFLGWSAPELSVAVPVILALLAGMLIGPVLTWVTRLRKRPKSRLA